MKNAAFRVSVEERYSERVLVEKRSVLWVLAEKRYVERVLVEERCVERVLVEECCIKTVLVVSTSCFPVLIDNIHFILYNSVWWCSELLCVHSFRHAAKNAFVFMDLDNR